MRSRLLSGVVVALDEVAFRRRQHDRVRARRTAHRRHCWLSIQLPDGFGLGQNGLGVRVEVKAESAEERKLSLIAVGAGEVVLIERPEHAAGQVVLLDVFGLVLDASHVVEADPLHFALRVVRECVGNLLLLAPHIAPLALRQLLTHLVVSFAQVQSIFS